MHPHTHAHNAHSSEPVIYEDLNGKEAVQMYETIQEVNNKPYQKVHSNQISKGYDENDAYGPHEDNMKDKFPSNLQGLN